MFVCDLQRVLLTIAHWRTAYEVFRRWPWRYGGAGVARAGARGGAQLGLRLPDAPDHGEPGTRGPA